MRGEEIPPRGQRSVGAVGWAVIVSTWSLWLTAVISHPGKEKAKVGGIKAELRTQGNTKEYERYHRVVYPEQTTSAGARKLRESQFLGSIIGATSRSAGLYQRDVRSRLGGHAPIFHEFCRQHLPASNSHAAAAGIYAGPGWARPLARLPDAGAELSDCRSCGRPVRPPCHHALWP